MSGRDLVGHYAQRFSVHGATVQALQWSDESSQIERFAILADGFRGPGSVLDFGCGFCDLLPFLREKGLAHDYLGIDVVPDFVEESERRLAGHDNADVRLAEQGQALPVGFDYVTVSGVFNNIRDDNWKFMTDTLSECFAVANTGVLFNAMSTYVDYEDKDIFYVDPFELAKYCKLKLGAHIVLRHDYVLKQGGFPFEFAMFLYKTAVV